MPSGRRRGLAAEAAVHGPIERPPAVAPLSDADVAERLFAEFEPAVGLSVLSDVVRRCRVVRRAALARSPSRGDASSLDDLARQAIASLMPASPRTGAL